MKKQNHEMDAAIIFLVILLGLRALGQFVSLIVVEDVLFSVISFVLGVIYILALAGVARRMKWGFAVAIAIAAFDAAIAFVTGGVFSAGALIVDLIIIVLAAAEIKKLNGAKKK